MQKFAKWVTKQPLEFVGISKDTKNRKKNRRK